jgi:hypothetical protein
MPVVVMASQVQGFLIDGRGYDAADVPALAMSTARAM